MDEAFTGETRFGQGADGPVQRDANPFAGLLVCFLDDIWGEQVHAAEVVLFAVLVEHSPGAMGHPVDGREAVEVREILVVGHGWCLGKMQGYQRGNCRVHGMLYGKYKSGNWYCKEKVGTCLDL